MMEIEKLACLLDEAHIDYDWDKHKDGYMLAWPKCGFNGSSKISVVEYSESFDLEMIDYTKQTLDKIFSGFHTAEDVFRRICAAKAQEQETQ